MQTRPRILGTGAVWILAAAVAPPLASADDKAVEVAVLVEGFKNPTGRARIALFNQGAGFPDNEAKAFRKNVVSIVDGRARIKFDGLPPGTYAVSMYHDENADEKFNKNVFGVPKEGYGVSKNIVHKLSAPKFEEASFSLEKGTKEVRINVHY